MISRIVRSSLFRSAGVYTLTNIINTSIPFLMLPVFTRYLSPFDYGIVSTFQVLVGFAAPFIGLSISGAISVKYYDKSSTDLSVYISSVLAILLISVLTVSAFFFFFRSPIGSIAQFPERWLWLIVVLAGSQFLIDIALTMWQVQVKPVPYGSFQIIQSLANVGLSVWLVVVLRMGWQGRLTAQVVVAFGFAAIALYLLWKNGWISRHFSTEYVKDAMKFGVPLIPHAFGAWVLAATDRVFINNMVGVADTGIYSVAYQIAMGITFIQVSFNLAWVPWLYDRLSRNDFLTNRRIVKFTYGYAMANIVVAVLLSVTAPWLLRFFIGKQFSGSIKFIAWLAASRAIMSMYYMTCNYIFYMKKTPYIAFSTTLSACVHAACLYFLIKLNGTVGAAQAGVISSIVLVSLVWYFAARVYPMPWFLQKSRNNANIFD